MLEDTLLVVETIPAVTYCEDCRRTYDTVAHGKICPPLRQRAYVSDPGKRI